MSPEGDLLGGDFGDVDELLAGLAVAPVEDIYVLLAEIRDAVQAGALCVHAGAVRLEELGDDRASYHIRGASESLRMAAQALGDVARMVDSPGNDREDASPCRAAA